jgi:hypothetical protein
MAQEKLIKTSGILDFHHHHLEAYLSRARGPDDNTKMQQRRRRSGHGATREFQSPMTIDGNGRDAFLVTRN